MKQRSIISEKEIQAALAKCKNGALAAEILGIATHEFYTMQNSYNKLRKQKEKIRQRNIEEELSIGQEYTDYRHSRILIVDTIGPCPYRFAEYANNPNLVTYKIMSKM